MCCPDDAPEGVSALAFFLLRCERLLFLHALLRSPVRLAIRLCRCLAFGRLLLLDLCTLDRGLRVHEPLDLTLACARARPKLLQLFLKRLRCPLCCALLSVNAASLLERVRAGPRRPFVRGPERLHAALVCTLFDWLLHRISSLASSALSVRGIANGTAQQEGFEPSTGAGMATALSN